MDEPVPHKSFSLLRRWGIALNVALSAAALFSIVVMLNYLSSRHFTRLEWSQSGRLALSPFTRQILNDLTNDIRITLLYDPEDSVLLGPVKDLLTEYDLASPRLEVDMVDYTRSRGRADYVKKQYRIESALDTLLVVFETAGRPPIIRRERELSDYDLTGAMRGQPVRRTGFKGEQLFTSALQALADARPMVADFLTGHGEPDLEDENVPEGYHAFRMLLAEKNIVLRPVSLRTNGVPSDCQLLVVAGPRSAIPPDELGKVDEYLKAGGRMLALLYSPARPGVRRSGLERVLVRWGADVGNNLVLDPAQSQAGDTRVILAERLAEHPITKPLQGFRLGMVLPCSVSPLEGSGQAGSGLKADPLVFTSPGGMAGTPLGDGEASVDITNAVISLAVAAEKGAIAEVRADGGTTRLVVAGEASMFSNALLNFEANRDFATLVVNWLLDRRQQLTIGPRPMQEYQINLTRTQMHGAVWVLLGVLPGGCLLFGLLIWLRRRK